MPERAKWKHRNRSHRAVTVRAQDDVIRQRKLACFEAAIRQHGNEYLLHAHRAVSKAHIVVNTGNVERMLVVAAVDRDIGCARISHPSSPPLCLLARRFSWCAQA